MSLTKILDTVEPSVFLNYMKEYTPEKYDLLGSSAITAPPGEVMSQFTAGGRIIDMPFWQDTDRSEPEILTDDDAIDSTAKKITASQETARKLYLGKSWSQADLAGVVATGSPKDPLAQIGDYMTNYWRASEQTAVVKCLQGVLADNIANDSSDMLYNTYSDVASPSASQKINPAAITSTRLTMGEMMDELDTIIVHSKVYGDMLNQDDIDFVQNSQLPFKIPRYAGMNVVVSDSCPVSTGYLNTPKYTSFLVGAGAIYFAEHFPDMAVEPYREPRKGRGGGVTSIFTRRHVLIHPKGFRFTSSSVADKSPSWSELATAANWDRKRQRKNIKIGFLTTN